MAIAEGVQGRVAYKFYSSAAISSTTEPVASSDPGASSAKTLRRVSSSLGLKKSTYQSREIRTDRQIGDFRHGTKRVQGGISGELSPATYFDFIEAAHRGTAAATISKSNTQFTSVTSNNGASTFIFAGGDPVAEGFQVGDIIRFANLAATANNAKNFLITGFGGVTNRTVTVYPAPATDAVADTAFTVDRPGKRTIVPASSHVSRKVAFEVYNEDLDVALLHTENRITGYKIGIAPGLATMEVMATGRNTQALSGASAPFFTSPSAATTTGICGSVNGIIRVGGVLQGVVTGLEVNFEMAAEAPDAINASNLTPEIFLGTANVTGSITAFFEDLTLFNAYANESETDLLVMLSASGADAADAIAIYIPRLKFGDGDVSNEGEGGQTITLPFQALRYMGSTAGIPTTTIQVHDTAAT